MMWKSARFFSGGGLEGLWLTLEVHAADGHFEAADVGI
jgi:hypothetical protein